MSKYKTNTLLKIKNALKAGHKVYWVHEGYEVHWSPANPQYHKTDWTYTKGHVLRVTYTQNDFGSLLVKSDLKKTYKLS